MYYIFENIFTHKIWLGAKFLDDLISLKNSIYINLLSSGILSYRINVWGQSYFYSFVINF